MAQVDVCILGAGMAGLATAWHLARAGRRDVLVLERAARAFEHSSGLNAAILRTVVEDPGLAELAARGARALIEPDPELSRTTFVDPVGLVLVADRAASARELERMVATAASRVVPVDADRVRERAPHFRATSVEAAFELPEEGTIDLAALQRALESGARRGGVSIRYGADVAEIGTGAVGVTGVQLASGERIASKQIVIAAGGWAGSLGARAGSPVRLEPTLRHAALARTGVNVDPRWPVVWNLGDNFYARPLRGGLMVCDCDQTPVDPDECAPEQAAFERLAEVTRRQLANNYAPLAMEGWCAMRTFAPRHRFALGADPVVDGLFWSAGLGGHGITTGLEVGRLTALALRGLDDPQLVQHAPARG